MTATGKARHDPGDTTDDDYGKHRGHDKNCSVSRHCSHCGKLPQTLRLPPGYFAFRTFPQNQFSAYLLNQCGPLGQRARGQLEAQAMIRCAFSVPLIDAM
jgi:hypothetical protein